MKAPTYPEADHSAASRPTTASSEPSPPAPCNCSTALVTTSRAGPGVIFLMASSTRRVADSPAIPSSDTSTSSPGKSASTP